MGLDEIKDKLKDALGDVKDKAGGLVDGVKDKLDVNDDGKYSVTEVFEAAKAKTNAVLDDLEGKGTGNSGAADQVVDPTHEPAAATVVEEKADDLN